MKKFGPNGRHFGSIQSFKQFQVEQGLLQHVLRLLRTVRDGKEREMSILITHPRQDCEIIIRKVSEASTRGEQGVKGLELLDASKKETP